MTAAKILIVEDEIIIARELEARLQGLGYEVVGIASSGREALALAEECLPNLVLMDIVLKGDMDGVEAAAHVRRRFRIPVIYVTAFADKATLERAKATEPHAYMVKPFAERELYANIEMALYRHAMEAKFRAMERWFAASMQKIADGVIGTSDVSGRINYINPAAEALTGWSSAEARGRLIHQVFRIRTKSGAAPARDPVEQTLAEGIALELEDAVLDNRAGDSIPVHYVSSCLRDEFDEPIGMVLVLRDLRAQKQAEASIQESQAQLEAQRQAALNLARDEMAARQRAERAEQEVRTLNAQLERRVRDRTAELEAANKELEAFSYSVSHDLRSPLRAIDGFARILLQEYKSNLPEEGQRYLRLACDNAKRMGTLIDDLLAFSRLGREPKELRSVGTTALVKAALAELRDDMADRPVEVVVGDLPDCHADPALLKQVFINLLSNAIKFTRNQPAARIEVGCRAVAPGDFPEGSGAESGEAGRPVYFVKDNGAGFDMQYASKLFGVFQRLHRAEEFAGTGVGLAIVQRIIRRHGGRAWAEGAVDRGATFYFTLG